MILKEVKESIFSVYYLVLKDDEITMFKYALILLIEYFQLLSFSFDETVSNLISLQVGVNFKRTQMWRLLHLMIRFELVSFSTLLHLPNLLYS